MKEETSVSYARSSLSNPRSYYAHSKEGFPPEQWHLLKDHLKSVATLAGEFAWRFASSDWAWNAGWLHDLGKAAPEFQAYLLRENGLDDVEYDMVGSGRVNHSSAGAAFAEEKFNLPNCPIGRVLAYMIAGHHAGLPDWFNSDSGNAAWSVRLLEGKENLDRIRAVMEDFVSDLKGLERPPAFVKPDSFHLWVRMIFSCLVDADFLDTESFMNPAQARQRQVFSSLKELQDLFNSSMKKMIEKSDTIPTAVNKVREEILQSCRNAAGQNPGLFSLTVPTGGGKTLSSMAFALDHAIRHGKDRIIYVIPYTSIIEQTAKVFSDIFGQENVVEHHSNLDPEKETQRMRFASENWDAPIVVTTNVQFFESLFAAKPSRCRKLHNIVNSVVIMDEAQLLPPGLLWPCVDAMNQLTRYYNATLVLTTATQPVLPKLDKPFEIIQEPQRFYEKLKRVQFSFPGTLDGGTTWEDLAARLINHKQALCIVNTRRDCYELFKAMPQGTFHLSALMCGEHRSTTIEKIKELLRLGLPVRVISTQLVEAGVDMDFPVVYRALAGLDSIAQAAGRCNREGKLDSLGQVHVFLPPKASPRGLLLKAENVTRELFTLSDLKMDDPNVFSRYFDLFYSRVNDMGDRFKTMLTVDDSRTLAVHFRTAAKEFRFIDDHAQQAVFVEYGASKKWLDELRCIGPTRENMRRLQRYTVNLSKHSFAEAVADGLLTELWKGYWSWIGRYDGQHGLDLFGGGWSPEDLIV